MLRLLLPPNLAAAVTRNAIPLKIELDLSCPPPPEMVPALAVLQRIGVRPASVLFLQLTCGQFRSLVAAARGQPVFFWLDRPERPLIWIGPILRGVTEHLGEPEEVSRSPSLPPPADPKASAPAPRLRAPMKPATPLTVDGSEHYLALTLPSRESAGYPAALDLVKMHGFMLEPSNRRWWLRDRHKVLNFLAAHGRSLREEFHAEFTDNFERNTARLKTAEVVAEASAHGEDYLVTLGLRAGRAADASLLGAVSSGRGYVEDGGDVYLIEQDTLERVMAAQRAVAGEPGGPGGARRTQRVARTRVAEVGEILESIAPGFQPPETWRTRSEALRHTERLQPAPVPPVLDRQLRPYQRLGVAWLWHLYRSELGGVLADEMGLGKTLQALALLAALKAVDPASPASLVICPASLVENWRREALRFAPGLRVFVHHGDRRASSVQDLAAFDLVITSYGTLARDREMFEDHAFSCVIGDEAQHIKNRRSQNAQALRSLRAQGRFLLTGTPLENSLDDLRSLFEFLMPGLVTRVPPGLRSDERAWYDERLRAQTAPYLLRRTKLTVAPELPPKQEQIIYCEPTPAQASLYRDRQQQSERDLLDLAAGGASEGSLRLATLTQLLRLRQICCDPRLVAPSLPPEASAKLEAFRELLDEALDEGHRLLIFSQFTSLLALLREELTAGGIAYCYLDGAMTAKARQVEVDRFQSADGPPLFLLSLKAGGTGLNLTAADVVVHLDPWWNPAVEAQATDRAHRIGQTRMVTSYKLICSGTVEEKVLAMQEEKRALLTDVFDASDAATARLNLADLRELLRE